MFDTVREVGLVAQRESIDCHFEQSGALEVAALPVQMQRLHEELDYARSFGFGDDDYRWLGEEEVSKTLRVDGALGGILMNHCAAIHPARLARGLAETVENSGVRLYEQSPVLKIDGHTAITPAGKVSATKIILATEGYTGSLPGQNCRLIPLHSMMVVTEPLTPGQIGEIHFHKRFAFGNLDRIVTYGQLTADNRIAFGCRGSYHFKSGIREFDPADAEFELVRQSLLRFFPSLEGIRFTHAWGGAMGVSRSLRPSVNYSPETGLGWAGGFFGNGVGATHLAGRTMADLVLGRDTDRVNTPWVNPPDALRRWEPEPLRWLGIKARVRLMQIADNAEYRRSSLAPAISGTLDRLFP